MCYSQSPSYCLSSDLNPLDVKLCVCVKLTLRLRRPWRSWCSSWRNRGSAGRGSRHRCPHTGRRSCRPRTARCGSALRAEGKRERGHTQVSLVSNRQKKDRLYTSAGLCWYGGILRALFLWRLRLNFQFVSNEFKRHKTVRLNGPCHFRNLMLTLKLWMHKLNPTKTLGGKHMLIERQWLENPLWHAMVKRQSSGSTYCLFSWSHKQMLM